ncbi:MAG: hypothetical protein B7Y41_10905 [Hydrogenophilales bacterium 28-61-23]|nr:MAG: hypothetical protein B7Y41_10905 [Hydrogenophilales bacterium 28-61-23]
MTTNAGRNRASLARIWLVRIWPLIVLLLLALVLWGDRIALWGDRPEAPVTQVDCATLTSGCSINVNGRQIRFGMSGAPKPLAPFQIWVDAAGVGKAEARFVMEGMDMGFNVYTLRADKQGILRAAVTLPVCVSGRRDWAMILDLDKTRLRVPFVTEL